MIPSDHQVIYSSRSRSLRLRITPQGKIIVSVPPYTPTFLINQFVDQHQTWITTQLQKVQRHQAATSPNEVLIFGRPYQKKASYSNARPTGVLIQNSQVLINPVTPIPSAKQTATQIDRFLKATATKYIVPRTHQLAQVMGISFGKITLRQQSSRWGSCSSAGNLNFNWRLVHFEPQVIDYVIIHELAHRQQMNHSAAFWQLVAQFDPEYHKHRGWLKRNGYVLE